MTPADPPRDGGPALGRLVPRTISGQVVALMVICVLIAQVVGAYAFSRLGVPAPSRSPIDFDARLAMAVRILAAVEPEGRDGLLATYARTDPDLALRRLPEDAPTPAGPPEPSPLHGRLDGGFTVWAEGPAVPRTSGYDIRLADGMRLKAAAPDFGPRPALGPIYVTVAFLAVGLVLFGSWAARAVTRPLRRLAAAVERTEPGAPAAMPQDGSAEVRAVAAAVGRLNERITALMADNARTLAAVGHDLRTPLTRLRADLLDDEELRTDFVADLDHMTALTESALDHLHGARNPEKRVRADCTALVAKVVDQFADLGADVTADLDGRVEASIAPHAVLRAVRNLVENAVRHAGSATVSVRGGPKMVTIVVRDAGPGIAEADRLRLMEPFERGDPTRPAGPGEGLGLGLSIARAVAMDHGGRLILADNSPHGLVATLELPAA